MKSNFLRLLLLMGAFCFAGFLSNTYAQVDSGRITGQVLDAKDAPIPGAKITARDERTNEERIVTTGPDGTYQFSGLRPSFYTITVSADQFASAQETGLQLTVGQQIHRNFALSVATLTASISVVSSVESAIDTSSASIGVNVNQREVSDLPI
jgi:hypothetical protein